MKKLFALLACIVFISILMYGGLALAKVEIRITCIPGPTQRYLEANAQAFMGKNPDISIIVDVAGGAEEVYKPNFPVIAASPDRPDMAWYWVDGRQYQDLVAAGLLEPLDDLYEQEGWYDIYPKTVLNKYTSPDGHKYAANTSVVWYPQVYYNKKIFQELGISTPNTPYVAYASVDEWYDIINKIREGGFEPLSYGGKEGWIIGHTHDAILQRMVPQEILDDSYNNWRPGWEPKFKYSDEIWTQAAAMLLEWKEKGVFAEGFLARSYPEGRMLFVQEKATMYQDGVWGVGILRNEAPEMDFGWMLYPKIKEEIDPKFLLYAGNGVMILKGTPNLEACKKFLAFLVSPEGQENVLKLGGEFSPRLDFDPAIVQKLTDPLVFDMWMKLQEIGSTTGWDDPVPAELAERSFILFQEMLTGARTPESVGQELELIAERLRKR